jgi:hypothetical protein
MSVADTVASAAGVLRMKLNWLSSGLQNRRLKVRLLPSSRMRLTVTPTEKDFRAACTRLRLPAAAWDLISAAATRTAAERMLAENQAAIRRLAEDNVRLSASTREEDVTLYQANAVEIDKLWKKADELQRRAFPLTCGRSS